MIQDGGGCVRQVPSDEANPPNPRHTVSYTECHPSHVLLMASHARIYALIRIGYLLMDVENLRFFFALSLSALFRRQGSKPLNLLTHLMPRLPKQ
jgi:hypothetical protein